MRNRMETASQHWDKLAEHISSLCKGERDGILMIAIDGRSGSGKTTLAGRIQEHFGGNVFHMDDFFLRPGQRTKERMEEVGGNVDYERVKELLMQIRSGKEVCYQAFDCKKQTLNPPVFIKSERLNIVEGSYSMHPYFGDVYDMKIALDIGVQLQRERILLRNGKEMLQRFEAEWIPKENAYFEKFHIFEDCDCRMDGREI